jgi:hypothetical protein
VACPPWNDLTLIATSKDAEQFTANGGRNCHLSARAHSHHWKPPLIESPRDDECLAPENRASIVPRSGHTEQTIPAGG